MHLAGAIIEETPSSSSLDPREPEDFAKLVEVHHRELLVYARALTREDTTSRDIVQEAFIVAYEKIEAFDVTRDFATWMRGIVRNKWREWLRKNRRYELTDEELSAIDEDIAAWQATRASGSSTVFDSLEICLEKLPDNLRETVQSFYYEGHTGDEASEKLGVAPAAVRKRLQRARALLKDCVTKRLELATPENPTD